MVFPIDLKPECPGREGMGLTSSLLGYSSNQTAERYQERHSSDTFGPHINNRGWENNQAEALRFGNCREGDCTSLKKTSADTTHPSAPKKKEKDTAGGEAQTPSAAVCSDMDQD